MPLWNLFSDLLYNWNKGHTSGKSQPCRSNREVERLLMPDKQRQSGGPDTNIRWDGSTMRSYLADACAVEASLGEIKLLFGTGGSAPNGGIDLPFGMAAGAPPAGNNMTVRFTNCIILNPLIAKRLAALLNNVLGEGNGMPAGTPDKPLIIPTALPVPCRTEGAPEKADLLIKLISSLGIEYGLERSFKLIHKTMLANRFMLSIHRNAVKEDPYYLITGTCIRLGMPDEFLGRVQENLPYAKIIYFGFEEDEAACTFKVYLEFVDRMMDAMLTGQRKSVPLLLFEGFKWDASGRSRRAITNYTCRPEYSPEDILEQVSAIYYGPDHRKSFDIVRDITGTASDRLRRKQLMYMDVTEEGNQRRSFDINVYNAGLLLEDIAPQLAAACRHFSIPPEEFNGFYDRMRTRKFGHISGGIDRKGRDFLTFYYGMEGH